MQSCEGSFWCCSSVWAWYQNDMLWLLLKLVLMQQQCCTAVRCIMLLYFCAFSQVISACERWSREIGDSYYPIFLYKANHVKILIVWNLLLCPSTNHLVRCPRTQVHHRCIICMEISIPSLILYLNINIIDCIGLEALLAGTWCMTRDKIPPPRKPIPQTSSFLI